MTQQRSVDKKDRTALTHFLRNAGEVSVRAYLDMLIGMVERRAVQTRSPADDVLVIFMRVMVDRLFPVQSPPSESQ